MHKKQKLYPLELNSHNIVEPMEFEVEVMGDEHDIVDGVLDGINILGEMEACQQQ
jgi:hypothetical protein